MNLTIRASSAGLRGMFGVIEGVTGVTASALLSPLELSVGARVATACGGVATDTASAGVTDAVPGWLLKLPSVLEPTDAGAVAWLLKLPAVLESPMLVAAWLLKLPSVLELLMATTSGISMRRARQR